MFYQPYVPQNKADELDMWMQVWWTNWIPFFNTFIGTVNMVMWCLDAIVNLFSFEERDMTYTTMYRNGITAFFMTDEPTGVFKYFDMFSNFGFLKFVMYKDYVNWLGIFSLLWTLTSRVAPAVSQRDTYWPVNQNVDKCLNDKNFCLVTALGVIIQTFGVLAWPFWPIYFIVSLFTNNLDEYEGVTGLWFAAFVGIPETVIDQIPITHYTYWDGRMKSKEDNY